MGVGARPGGLERGCVAGASHLESAGAVSEWCVGDEVKSFVFRYVAKELVGD